MRCANRGNSDGRLKQENEPHGAHHTGDGEHDGLRHHHVADEHGPTRGCFIAVMDRHRCRLHGHRVLLFPVRHLLPALWRAIRLHRRGACKVRLFSVLLPVLPVAGHRQRGGGHFGSGLHDVVHALAGKRRHSLIRWNGRPALADHRGEFRRPRHHRQDWCGYGVGG